MSTQLQQELNPAQASIYSRTNIRRAYPDFDDTEIGGIYLRGDDCIVVRRDGSQQAYQRSLIKQAFSSYTHRLKDFFSYLGPNYRGPSVWHNNAYIIFKGWTYTHALGHLSSNAKLQQHWADKFIHLSDPAKVTAILQSDQTDLGHLVAPDGMRLPDRALDMESELDDVQEQKPLFGEPSCSCGSFQRQLSNLSAFQEEIQGFKPWCIHLTWFNKYRELLSKRTEVRNTSPSGAPEKCVAWWYAPPSDHSSDGRFLLLHTKSGAQAPLSHWRTYKPSEVFTQHHAWDLFFNMMEAGYTPFPGTSLPQLKNAFKK
ncbi:MAG: hypothetical protein ACO24D_18035 [bacterium]